MSDAPRQPAQVTLSTIGDVSIAVADAVQSRSATPSTRLLPAVVCFGLAYAGFALLLLGLADLRHQELLLVAPLLPALLVALFFLLWQRAAARARAREAELKTARKQLESLAYEASNTANALRANLLGVRTADPPANAALHLREIETVLARIEAFLRRSGR